MQRHDDYHDYLRKVPLFAQLRPNELDAVARRASDLRLEPGRVLLRQGELAHEMMVVTSGRAEVSRDGERIAEVGPGDCLGETGLLARGRRNSTVTATTAVELIHLTDADFGALLAEVPSVAVRLLPVLAARAVGRDLEEVAP